MLTGNRPPERPNTTKQTKLNYDVLIAALAHIISVVLGASCSPIHMLPQKCVCTRTHGQNKSAPYSDAPHIYAGVMSRVSL